VKGGWEGAEQARVKEAGGPVKNIAGGEKRESCEQKPIQGTVGEVGKINCQTWRGRKGLQSENQEEKKEMSKGSKKKNE